MNNSVNLAFGRHDLKVFDDERFSHLKLNPKAPPVEKRTHWLVNHEGKTIPVMKCRPGFGNLVHILRDPSHKGNLIAVRKDDLRKPLGDIHLSIIHPSGEEIRLGRVELTAGEYSGYRDLANIYDLVVAPYALRKPGSKPQKKDPSAKHDSYAEYYTRANTASPRFWPSLSAALREDIDPPNAKHYNYHGKKLGQLLICISEELAAKEGYRKIWAEFNRRTIGKDARPKKFGWRGDTVNQSYFKDLTG